ncbi:MAG: hypothetical protein AB1333_03130 [Patescibacteria group bacterium]
MKEIKNYEFSCPRCNTLAYRDNAIFTRKYSVVVPIIPYFTCPKCRLIFVSKRLVRAMMNRWWRTNKLECVVPFEMAYNEVVEYLKGVVEYYKQIKYKEVRFKKYSLK